MNRLSPIFSQVRAELFRLLFGLRQKRMYQAEIIGFTDFANRSVEEELKKLTDLELLIAVRDGNRIYYSANTDHPLYPEIRNMVLKTSGMHDVLQEALVSEKIEFAFVFGSLAQLTERAESDVDLMVIGSLANRELATLLRGVTERIGREINSHIFGWDELAQRTAKGDHFIRDVLEKPKLFIKGDENEFGDMARRRLAAPVPDKP